MASVKRKPALVVLYTSMDYLAGARVELSRVPLEVNERRAVRYVHIISYHIRYL